MVSDSKIKINIISPGVEIFEKQLSPEWNSSKYHFYFNSHEDIIWDSVVVYENVNESFYLKCRKGGMFFISGEPPIVKTYSQSFIDLFDHVISSHNIKHPNSHRDQQALPWYFGYNFETKSSSFSYQEIEQMALPCKTKKISFITSTRKFLPGHKSRLVLLKKLQKTFGDVIDFYGKGINEIDDKAMALMPYEFSICVENSYVNSYWTEKIADSFLAYSVPIYCGCKNINEYFSDQSMISIDIHDIDGCLRKIETIIDNSDEIYDKMLPYVKESRDLLLFKYNLFPFVISYIEKYVDLRSNSVVEKQLNPYNTYPINLIKETLLKAKRIILKNF